jgi:glycosyltransferase involved in cell wall biosynthesis
MLFSIIIPIYNAKEYMHRCLGSVLPQKSCEAEIILVDDGSTDGSSELCDEYAKHDDRIRVIHKPNGGLVSARNTGIKAARGDYILYIDDDDWVAPNWLETIHSCITSAPEKPDLVIFGSMRVHSDRKRVHLITAEAGFYDRARLEKEIFPRLVSDPDLYIEDAVFLPASWNRAFKRELLEEHHCFDEGIRLGEDTAYVFECVMNSNAVVICKDVLYFYNKLNEGSITSKYDTVRIRKRLRLFQYIESRKWTKDPLIVPQMNDFYASRIIYDITGTYLSSSTPAKTARHLKKELKETQILKYAHVSQLPLRPALVILMLKLGLCRFVLWAIKRFYK